MKIDYSKYLKVCREALQEPEKFDVFRRHPDYGGIVETVVYDWGKQCLDLTSKGALSFLPAIEPLDDIGGPLRYEYTVNGKLYLLSPSTCRYLKIASDLMFRFGSLENFEIVEIGVGFGGQCAVLKTMTNIKSYTLVDLPEVLDLTKRYLLRVGFEEDIFFRMFNDPQRIMYDLCISNYAFSEFPRETQMFYADRIIQSSKYGYMLCNFLDWNDPKEAMSSREIFSLHEGQILEEDPLTDRANKLFIW